MASTLPIPRGFVLLKLGGFSEFEGGTYLLPRSQFSTIESLTNAVREYYNIRSFSIKSIKFTIVGGRNEVLASVRRDHWAELYNKEAFNCVSVEEDILGGDDLYGIYRSRSGDKEYIACLSMGLWPRVI